MADRLRLEPYGPDAWLLRFAERPGEAAFQAAQAIRQSLEAETPPDLIEHVPGYTSYLLEFRPGTTRAGSAALATLLGRLQDSLTRTVAPGPIREIPVIYDGPDMERVAAHAGLTTSQVRELHATPLYRVALLGFAPGFPYLDGLDPRLNTPRLDMPRPHIPPGSVAIGGSHAGIYSIASPGGWNLIGHTPIRLFDPGRATLEDPGAMCWLRPGDRVRFIPAG